MKVHFGDYKTPEKGTWAVGVFEGKKMTEGAQAFDKITQGLVSRALENHKFSGKLGETLELVAPTASLKRLVLIGLGQPADLTAQQWQVIGGHAATFFQKTNDHDVTFFFDEKAQGLIPGQEAAHAANGFLLKSWKFDHYKTQKKSEDKSSLKEIYFVTAHKKQAEKTYEELHAVTEGVLFARSVITEPSNVITPSRMAELVEDFEKFGIEVEILKQKEMKKLGMGALLGVAQGSALEPHLIILHWKGGKKDQKPISFVGKGVTFDSGGLSLKPADSMEQMKYDMAGSAIVAGTLLALAKRKAKVNVIGVMGMVENMPSGTAQRPGDVVTSMSGQTIEVLNTDAEGRLVLADALWYTQDRFKPEVMIDLATLTGAIVVALGSEYAGVFSNTEKLAQQLVKAGKNVDEKVWAMPLGEAYHKLMDSPIADMKNVTGRASGVSTSATFLERFVNKTPWAHLDIAGVTWADKERPLCVRGATGFGVRLLDQWVKDIYEAS